VAENSEFTFKLGIVDGKVLTVEEVKQLATMPGKEEIFAKLLFLINSPAQRLATVINATGRDLAVVINQAVEKDKFSGPKASAVEQAPAVEQASVVEQAAAVEQAPAVEEAAVVEQAPAVEEPQAAEQPPVVEAATEPAPAAEASAPESEVSGGEETAS
jgi:large subunit ribosomal protein L10